jgi:hypothetical protein
MMEAKEFQAVLQKLIEPALALPMRIGKVTYALETC